MCFIFIVLGTFPPGKTSGYFLQLSHYYCKFKFGVISGALHNHICAWFQSVLPAPPGYHYDCPSVLCIHQQDEAPHINSFGFKRMFLFWLGFPKWWCSREVEGFQIQGSMFVEAEEADSTIVHQMYMSARGDIGAFNGQVTECCWHCSSKGDTNSSWSADTVPPTTQVQPS